MLIGVETGGPGTEQSKSWQWTWHPVVQGFSTVTYSSSACIGFQGSPLYSHNSVKGNTGRGPPLVPCIVPRAREGRFVSGALGRSGSGEWVCCAWGGLIMEGFDLAAVWKEPWEVLEDRGHHVEGESRAAVTRLTCIFWWLLGCTPASDSFPRTPTTPTRHHFYVCHFVLTDVLWTKDSETTRQLFHGGFEEPRSGGLVQRRLIAV